MLNNQISTLFPIIDHHFPYNSQLHSAGRVGSRPSARPGVLEVVNIATGRWLKQDEAHEPECSHVC